jgi:hypothetical protein
MEMESVTSGGFAAGILRITALCFFGYAKARFQVPPTISHIDKDEAELYYEVILCNQVSSSTWLLLHQILFENFIKKSYLNI